MAQDNNNQILNSLERKNHLHQYQVKDNYEICSICGRQRLKLNKINDDLLQGKTSDGKKYSVRTNRMSFFMPQVYEKFYEEIKGERAKRTIEVLLQTGARINEARNIKKRDIDWDRNTIKLRVTKTKARKSGEERGKPRTIPINSEFIKKLKKFFKDQDDESSIDILSTPALNIAIKKTLKKMGVTDYYMYSAHNIRKTHGNWLKVLGNARMIDCDAMEICLRLGHDYNTFLSSYGSSNNMNSEDMIKAKQRLGDLYERKW